MSYIQFHSVVKDYRQGNGVFRALDDATFDVEQGEVVALLGSSGSGKTTALNLLGGLDQPSGGSIRVGQTDVSALSRRELTAFRKSEVGFVFQLYNLVEGLTVYENVNVVRLDRSAHVTSGTRHGSGSAPGTGRPMPQR